MQWKPAGLRCIQESVASHTPFDSSVSDHRTQFKQNTFLPHYSPVSLSLDCFRCSRHPRAALSNGSTHTARHLALGTAPSHKSPSQPFVFLSLPSSLLQSSRSTPCSLHRPSIYPGLRRISIRPATPRTGQWSRQRSSPTPSCRAPAPPTGTYLQTP